MPAVPGPEYPLLHRILRGERANWPDGDDGSFATAFLEACGTEGLAPLVHYRVVSTADWPRWPAAVRERLSHEARMNAALEMLRAAELAQVLARFAEGDVRVLLFKGAPLAYSHYPEPQLRTRCDADLLIERRDRASARNALETLGYLRSGAVSGELVSYQETLHKPANGYDHAIDLHWQINNGQVFAQALRFDEAMRRSVPVPALGAAARTLCAPHALLVAC